MTTNSSEEDEAKFRAEVRAAERLINKKVEALEKEVARFGYDEARRRRLEEIEAEEVEREKEIMYLLTKANTAQDIRNVADRVILFNRRAHQFINDEKNPYMATAEYEEQTIQAKRHFMLIQRQMLRRSIRCFMAKFEYDKKELEKKIEGREKKEYLEDPDIKQRIDSLYMLTQCIEEMQQMEKGEENNKKE
jgi:hypothetical protein